MEMNKALIDCMQLLRRRVRNEQGIDIHLHQPDAVEALLMASRTSREPQTYQLGERLAQLIEKDQLGQRGSEGPPGTGEPPGQPARAHLPGSARAG